MSRNELHELAHNAAICLIEQRPVIITRRHDTPRNGFPLPIKKEEANADGNVTQQYRPLAILEYINEVLSGELASRQAKARKAKEPA